MPGHAVALALGTRRSTIAAVASALAAMALAAAVAGRSCQVTQPGPEMTVRDLLQAAKTNNRDLVFELLTPATRTRLDAEAKRATDLVVLHEPVPVLTASKILCTEKRDALVDPEHVRADPPSVRIECVGETVWSVNLIAVFRSHLSQCRQ